MAELHRKALGTQIENLADKRQVIVNCSAEDPDRVGDVVVQTGIDFTAFMKIGGTVLWQHNPEHPIAKALEMSIVGGRLRSLVQFPDANVSSKANEIYGLIRCGIVNAASIGFNPKEYEPIDPRQPSGPQRFNAVELMEFSFVSVPCAPAATIVARSRSLATARYRQSQPDPAIVASNRHEYELREAARAEGLAELTHAEWDVWLAREYPGVKSYEARAAYRARTEGYTLHDRFMERVRRSEFAKQLRTGPSADIRPERKDAEPSFKWDPYALPAVNMANMRLAESRRFYKA